MCRAIWAIIYAADNDAAKKLRRAAGAEVDVVAMATTTDELTATIATTRADILIVDAGAPSADKIATMVRSKDRGVVWVGDGAPGGTLVAAWDDQLADTLPSAITRALLARGK
jgi:NADPH:quinone reductase-like Zn-dependent oxidoreductase